MATKRQARIAKVIAQAFGAEFADEEEPHTASSRRMVDDDKVLYGSEQVSELPFNLGYSKLDSNA